MPSKGTPLQALAGHGSPQTSCELRKNGLYCENSRNDKLRNDNCEILRNEPMGNRKNDIHWLWDASDGYRFRIALCALLGMTRIAASLTFVWLTKSLIDFATSLPDVTFSAGTAGGIFQSTSVEPESGLVLGIAAMALCVIIQLASSAARSRLTAKVEVSMRNAVRLKLMDHLLNSRWTGRETFHTGDLLNRLEGDAGTLSRILSNGLPSAWTTLFQLLASAAFLLALSPGIALAVILSMPILLMLSKLYFRRMRRLTKEIRSTDSRVQSYLQENLQHRSLITAFEQAPSVTEGMTAMQSGLEDLVMRRNTISVFSFSVVGLGFSLGYLLAFGWGVRGIAAGTVSFGALTAFLQLVGQVQRPVVELAREIPSFVNALTSVERLREISSLPLEKQGDPIVLPQPIGVRFSKVTFAYQDSETPVLKDFSCDFAPGTMTAVLGETGIGKSTLVRLMLALLEPSSGTLEAYSETNRDPSDSPGSCGSGDPSVQSHPSSSAVSDLRSDAGAAGKSPVGTVVPVSPRTRANFLYVPQGNSLISGTIRENLLLGDPLASDKMMLEALHSAAADFVRDLPLGLDTPCGEMGAGLSEGQAQRVAIARALLRPGGIVLLDEPTSSLDSETEALLMERLSEKLGGRTLILITHQPGTASHCERTVTVRTAGTSGTVPNAGSPS